MSKPKTYRFYTDSKNNTYCVSTFAGKEVRGITHLDPRDTNNPNLAMQLAQAKCDYKIALKRVKLSMKRTEAVRQNLASLKAEYEDKMDYLARSTNILLEAEAHLKTLLDSTK